jgi:hypothetical protein
LAETRENVMIEDRNEPLNDESWRNINVGAAGKTDWFSELIMLEQVTAEVVTDEDITCVSFDHIPLGSGNFIYEGSDLTVLGSTMLLHTLYLEMNLNQELMKKVIKVLLRHLPKKNNVIKSPYLLRKFFASGNFAKYNHRFCTYCKGYVESEVSTCCESDSFGNFTTYSLAQQIQNFFQRRDFKTDLSEGFDRNTIPGKITSIMDGSYIQKTKKKFPGKFDLTLMMYTDGVKMFESCKLHVWPIIFVINELSYEKRFLPQNMILGGLWWSKIKPDFNTFLFPIYNDTKVLRCSGLTIPSADIGKIKVGVTTFSADKPAKADVFNMIGHCGKRSCIKCDIEGCSVPVVGQKRKQFCFSDPSQAKRRTLASVDSDMKLASATGKACNGFKGTTNFRYMVPNFIIGTAEDSMHGIFGGAGGKKLMNLWFSEKFKTRTFSCFASIPIINERITKILPPNFVRRRLRTLDDLAFYKTSEYKNWFLYYAIPLMHDILDKKYFDHFFKLWHAINILNSQEISFEEINQAEKFLLEFEDDMPTLYGAHIQSANMHSLRHLPDTVRQLGPLYEMSCFPMESMLGKMKKFVLGPNNPPIKIHSAFNYMQNFPKFHDHLRTVDSETAQLIDDLSRRPEIKSKIYSGVYIVGSLTPAKPSATLFALKVLGNIDLAMDLQVPKCWNFYRLKTERCTVVASNYLNSKVHDSSFVVTKNGDIFRVLTFVKYKLCKCNIECECEPQYTAIGFKCIKLVRSVIPANKFASQIIMSSTPCGIDVRDIKDTCACIFVNKKYFCFIRANTLEFE